jgi:undecaprenyl-diphosphatase
MTLVHAIILGIVQGLTEFLPISSTAHLRITPPLLGWDHGGGQAFETVIQMGTLVAVIWYFRADIFHLLGGLKRDVQARKLASNHESKLAWMIAIATVPVGVCGLLLEHKIKNEFRDLRWVAFFIGFFALVLWAAEIYSHRKAKAGNPGKPESEIGFFNVITMGLFQCLALFPGASRSGTTISGALFSGLDRAAAARFSFLLSLPAITAAGLYKLYKDRHELFATQEGIINLVVSTVVSGIVGYFAIAWLIGFLKRYSTTVFIVYRILLAILLIVLVQQGIISPLEEPE